MKKSLVALLMALVLILACAPSLAEDKPVFVLGIPDHPNVIDWETNKQTLLIEEKFGVDLQFQKLPYDGKERQQKLELMMLAGGDELPDILINPGFDLAALMQYGDQGMIVPLNDYMDDMPYLDAALEGRKVIPVTKEDYIRNVTCADGNIYALAYCMMSVNNSVSGCRLMIYQPWLDKLGLEIPNTTEELLNVLRHFRDDDPNGNGLKDEIPLVSSTNMRGQLLKALMNPFIYYQDNYVANDNGTLVFNAEQEAWRDGLRFIKQLVDEGLLSTLSFTQDNAQMTALMSNDPQIVGCMGRNSASNLPASDPNRENYVLVGALEGPTGLRQQTQVETSYTPRFVVTKNCKDVALAMKLGDYMSSEEISYISRYGFEGENYVFLTGDEVGESVYASLGFTGNVREINQIWGSVQNTHWNQMGPETMDGTLITYSIIYSPTEGKYDHTVPIGHNIKRELDYVNTENRVGNMIFNLEEQEVITEYRSTINSAVSAAIADFVTGVRDLDKDWDAYVKSLHDMGLDTYMEAMQSCWTRMLGE